MKYKVIGWTDYDNDLFEDGTLSHAAVNAIIDDIRENGYFFSGYDHQERLYGAPVLNDGKRRVFSQRGFGAVMAEAYKEEGDYAYSLYAFEIKPDRLKMPTLAARVGYTQDSDLSECFEISLGEEEYKTALDAGIITLEDDKRLRMIDKGDTVLIAYGGEKTSLRVTWAELVKVEGRMLLEIRVAI